jgi:hypothetical protein
MQKLIAINQTFNNDSNSSNGTGGITNPAIGNLNNNSGVQFFQKLIPSLIGLIFVAGAIIFFFMLLISGIQWITSGGDKAAVEGAKGRLTQALIGIVVLFSAFAIIKLVQGLFGINILSIDIGPLIIK